MSKPKAFIIAPNRPKNGRSDWEKVGILLVFPDGNYDYAFKTIEDQGEIVERLWDINWDNPEVADYIRERIDNSAKCAFAEVDVLDGDTLVTLYKRHIAEKSVDFD